MRYGAVSCMMMEMRMCCMCMMPHAQKDDSPCFFSV
jgi:hypothetical protein